MTGPESTPLVPSELKGTQKKALVGLMAGDELMRSIGVLNLVLTVVLVLRFPQFFWILHFVKALIYVPWRFVRFRRLNCELYLLDFCYAATYLAGLCCLLACVRVTTGYETYLHQYNSLLIRAGFTFANGSLAWSILIFKNSLTFYNIDHQTSVFIHLSPAVFFWCLRWGSGLGLQVVEGQWPGMFDVCPGVPAQEADRCLDWSQMHWCTACPAAWGDFVWRPALVYFVCWALPYYVLVFHCLRGWIKARGKETLYSSILTDRLKSKFIRLFPEAAWPFAYMLQHFLVMEGLGVLTAVFWHSFAAHTLFGVLLLVAAVHNGSTYTFQVFALRYAAELLRNNPDAVLREPPSEDDAPKVRP